MENLFKNMFAGETEDQKRSKLHSSILHSVDEQQGYLNKEEYKNLLAPTLLTDAIETKKLEELISLLGTKEEVRSILDEWLIENEELIPMVATTRNKFGTAQDEDGNIPYPHRVESVDGITEEDTEKDAALAKEDYVRRMKAALSILDEDFHKRKLDNLYCDTGGSPEFESELSALEESLLPLVESERKKMIHDFLENLRG